jgi:peptide/nickel transport system ATP-binding protein/oligopeptide transport system ATP-binding protein
MTETLSDRPGTDLGTDAGSAGDSGRAAAGSDHILEVTNLRKYFPVKSPGLIRRTVGQVQAVDGISFAVPRGRSLGLVDWFFVVAPVGGTVLVGLGVV